MIQKKSGSFGGANVSVDLSNPARAVRDSLQYIFDMVTRPPTGALFAQASQDMIESLSKMVWLDDAERVNYLVPLVEQAQDSVLSIATLNYDNTIELAGEAAEVPVSTGIEEWSQTGQFEKPKSGIELLKLHGSIDWELDENRRGDIYEELRDRHGNLLNRLPHDVITQRPKDKVGEGRHTPSLIFGAGNKLTARGPYLELLRTFRQRLEEHNELLVIGYSFSDEHVNEVIYGWLNRDQERRITVVEKPGAVLGDNYFTKYFSQMLVDRCKFLPEGSGAGIRAFFSWM